MRKTVEAPRALIADARKLCNRDIVTDALTDKDNCLILCRPRETSEMQALSQILDNLCGFGVIFSTCYGLDMPSGAHAMPVLFRRHGMLGRMRIRSASPPLPERHDLENELVIEIVRFLTEKPKAAPTMISRAFANASFYGIVPHIAKSRYKLGIIFDYLAIVSPLKDLSRYAMLSAVIRRIARADTFKQARRRNLALIYAYDNMKMICHDGTGEYLDTAKFEGTFQAFNKEIVVFCSKKDIPSVYSAITYVIKAGARYFSWLSWHIFSWGALHREFIKPRR